MPDETITVKRELLETCLEIAEHMWHPCGPECECIIHPLRAVLGQDDSPEARRAR